MSELKQALSLNYGSLLMQIMVILVAIIFVVKTLKQFSGMFKKPKSWVDMNNSDHQKILEVEKMLKEHLKYTEDLKAETEKKDTEITASLAQLKEMFVGKDVQDLKYTILDFSSSISAGRRFSKQQYDNILQKISKYDSYVQKYGIINHKMEKSVEYIEMVYKKLQQQGFQNNRVGGINDIKDIKPNEKEDDQ